MSRVNGKEGLTKKGIRMNDFERVSKTEVEELEFVFALLSFELFPRTDSTDCITMLPRTPCREPARLP